MKRSLALLAMPWLCLTGVASSTAVGAAGAQAPGVIVFWTDSPWPSIWSVRPDGSRVRRILRSRQNARRLEDPVHDRSSLRVMNADSSLKRRLAVVGSEPDWG